MIEVNNILAHMADNPTKLQQHCSRIANLLNQHAANFGLIVEVAFSIADQGIADSKFRYHGGKLCEHLCDEVARFDEALYKHMTREFALCRDHYDRGASVLGTAFFFAELIRLKRDYRGALCALLDLACVIGSDDAFRCVTQILKMCGRDLEPRASETPDPNFPSCDLERVMERLRTQSLEHTTRTIRALLTGVIEYRAKNWGGSQDTQPSDAPKELPVLGTVHYTTDGKIERIVEDATDGQSGGELDPTITVELDEEADQCFEEFLREQGL